MSGQGVIEAYLKELEARPPLSASVRDPIVEEVGDHLCEAAEAERGRGLDASTAERLAVERFGPARDFACDYFAVRAEGSNRVTAWTTLVSSVGVALLDGQSLAKLGLLFAAVSLLSILLLRRRFPRLTPMVSTVAAFRPRSPGGGARPQQRREPLRLRARGWQPHARRGRERAWSPPRAGLSTFGRSGAVEPGAASTCNQVDF